MIKLLKLSFKLLLSLIIVLFLSVLLLLGTHSGTQWLLGTAKSFTNGALTYQQMQGHLLGDFQITDLEYQDQSIKLKINQLIFSWLPKDLLQGNLSVEQLIIESVYFEQTATTEKEVEKPLETDKKFTLSDIVLPIDISINEIKISDLQIIPAADAKPILIDLIALKAEAKDSTINIHHIDINAPEVSFSTEGEVSLIDNYPLAISTDFSSSIKEFPKLSLTGKINGNLEQLNIKQSLTGELEGQISLSLQQLLVKPSVDIAVNILGNGVYENIKFIINGQIEQQLDLKWNIEAPQLKQLIPKLEGALSAKGSVSGTQASPVLQGLISLDKISMENNQLNQARLDFTLSPEKNYANNLKLSIDSMSSGENHIKDLLLTLDGTIEQHKLVLKSLVLDNQLLLEIEGALTDAEQANWQGAINQFSIKGKALGQWQQKETTALIIAADKIQMDKLCLSDRQSSLCTHGQWEPQQANAKLQLSNVNLSRFKEFLPKEIDELSGELNIDAVLSLQEQLQAKVDIELKPGVFSYMIETHKRIRLKHKNTKINAVYNETDAKVNWNLSLGEHGFTGHISLPRNAVDKDINTAPLNGAIKLNIKELGLITALVPEISKAEGFISADLKLAGNISDPLVSGAAKFVSKNISIPLAGIEYRDIQFNILPKANKQIEINGQLYSGKEKLSINGSAALDEANNWPAKINIKSNNFQLINLPDIQALISTDINILHGKQGVSIAGKLTIPQAGIYLTDLPEGSQSASDDVIIVSKGKPVKKEPKASSNMNLDLAIKLGNNVHVKAFGLETHLKGEIDIKQEPGQLMLANGEVATIDGTFRAYGQDLIIEQGRIFYAGGFIDDPGLSIKAGKDIDGTSVGVMVNGSAKNILFDTYSSDPNLSSKDITSLLITGQKFDASGSAQIYAGTELSKNLSAGVNLGGETGSEAVVRYKLGEKMHFEGTSTSVKSAGELIYTIEVE